MKKVMYAILAVPVVAALIAGITFLPTMFATPAVALPQQSAQINSQALNQENEGVTEQNDDDDEVEEDIEDEVEESVDANLAAQVKISANEAGVIAANYLSVQPSAVKSIELENEGDLHYSVELVKDNQTYDIEVNAITGTVGNVEQDD